MNIQRYDMYSRDYGDGKPAVEPVASEDGGWVAHASIKPLIEAQEKEIVRLRKVVEQATKNMKLQQGLIMMVVPHEPTIVVCSRLMNEELYAHLEQPQ